MREPVDGKRVSDRHYHHCGDGEQPLGAWDPSAAPTNRVMSDFHKFMLLIFGLLVGLIFNVLVLVYVYHSGVPAPMRMGIVFGLIGSIIFSLFINIASGF